MPSVRNPEQTADRERSSGQTTSKTEIVATQATPQSDKQLIYRAEARKVQTEPKPLENLIARSAAPEPVTRLQPRKATLPEPEQRARVAPKALDPPPELAQPVSALAMRAELARLPKPAAKKFTAPPSGNTPVQAAEADFGAPPELQSGANPAKPLGSLTLAHLPKPAAKKFSPPSANAARGGATGKPVDFGAAPDIAPGQTPLGTFGSGQIPKLARRKFQLDATGSAGGQAQRGSNAVLDAPPELRAPGKNGQGGTDQADLVVLSLNPGKAMAPPDARMSGAFSRGSEAGPAAHAENPDPNALVVPGVSTRPTTGPGQQFRLQSPAQILGAEAADGYFEVKLELARLFPKLSVPLSPSRRMLPRRIEPYFRGRSVFTLAVPIEKMDRYNGDWILWFAPKADSGVGSGMIEGDIKMETPLPFWKLESRRWLVSGAERGVEQRVMMAVEINRDGRVQVKELMGRFGNAMNQLVTNDISRWVFYPARVNGRPIDVDAVVEIPFRIPDALAGMP